MSYSQLGLTAGKGRGDSTAVDPFVIMSNACMHRQRLLGMESTENETIEQREERSKWRSNWVRLNDQLRKDLITSCVEGLNEGERKAKMASLLENISDHRRMDGTHSMVFHSMG
jgi:hypothetical protein